MATDSASKNPDLDIQFHVQGFKEKKWSNASGTTHRLYIHKVDGEQNIECGYLDTVKLSYRGPDKRRKHADHNVVLCKEGDKSDDTTLIATILINDDTLNLRYNDENKVLKPLDESTNPIETIESDEQSESPTETVVPIPVADPLEISISQESPQKVLEGVASIHTKVIISYGNTVEVKSRKRGFIQSQYPKFSLAMEFEGGNIVSKVDEAADAVVKMVEDRLTAIINDLTKDD